MHIQKAYELSAPLDAVWEIVSRIKSMQECIPNIDTFQQLDDKHFIAVVKPALSFLTGKITMQCEVLAIKKPTGRLKVLGKIIGASFEVVTQITVSQINRDEKRTSLVWIADVEMQGLLKTAPESIVTAIADRLADEMFRKVEELASKQEKTMNTYKTINEH